MYNKYRKYILLGWGVEECTKSKSLIKNRGI